MKRRVVVLAAMLAASWAMAADQYVFVLGGKVASAPRDLPSVGVRLDSGRAVLGLHGASDSVKAACGWYRVIPSVVKAAEGEYVASRSYTVNKETVQEVVSVAKVPVDTRTPAERIGEVMDSIVAESTDARVSALVRAVATAVTGRVAKAVTVTIPASKDTR